MRIWHEVRPYSAPKMARMVAQHRRKLRAEGGWFNWYVNRRRMGLSPTKRELRQVSWRRAH